MHSENMCSQHKFLVWEELSLCSAATNCQENTAQLSMVKNNAGENVMFL